MSIIYDITNIFLDAVLKGTKLMPDGFIDEFNNLDEFINGFPTKASDNIGDIVQANTAVVATVGVGLALTILTPIIGRSSLLVFFKIICDNNFFRNYFLLLSQLLW